MKAIFHINELSKWKTTFNSSMNAIDVAALRNEVPEIYIVANADAVKIMVPEDEETEIQRKRIFQAIEKGVKIRFCRKAMELRNIELPADLEKAGCETVLSSAITMIDLQAEGFAYIKS